MLASIKISAAIITFNEEDNIERSIKSVLPVVEEVIVIDSFSQDRTKELAEKLGARVIENPFDGHIEQKNFAVKQTSFDWVLSLDADEELSVKLQNSILEIKSYHLQEAYQMNRLTSYCGHWVRHCGWYPDTKIRLWKKTVGHWGGTNPHDKVVLTTDKKVQKLRGDLLHYSYVNVSQHIRQMDKFSTIGAEEAFKKGKNAVPYIHSTVYPFWVFINTYFFKLGVLDGYFGFIICINGAFYKYLKYIKLLNLKKYNDKG